jgi:hypothetical protein
VIKSRRTRWTGHVALIDDNRGVYGVLVRKSEGRSHVKDTGINGRVILSWIFRKWDEGYRPDCSGSGKGQVSGTCECGNEPSGSIKCGEFLD